MCSSGDVCDDVVRAIQQFDAELGRPPFPSAAPPSLLQRAEAILAAVTRAVRTNKKSALEHVEDVTQTLPILCASLPDGSGGAPCLALYRILLEALSLVCTYSSFPVLKILSAADTLLPADDVVVFRLASASGAMTPERLAGALHVTLPRASKAPTAEATAAGGKKTKGKSTAHKADDDSSSNNSKGAAGASHVSQELLREVLATSLSKECRAVVLLLFDKTTTFSDLVSGDGSLASAILNVYGDYMLPRLKPLALLDCLDATLLDHFVDLLQQHHVFALHFLDDRKTADVTAEKWQPTRRIVDLCTEAGTRRVSASDAFGSLVSVAFLALVATSDKCQLSDQEKQHCLESLWAALGKALLLLVVEKGSEMVVTRDAAANLTVATTLARVVKPTQIVISCSECVLLGADGKGKLAETAAGIATLYQQVGKLFLHVVEQCVAKPPKAAAPPAKSQQQARLPSHKPTEGAKNKKGADKGGNSAPKGKTKPSPPLGAPDGQKRGATTHGNGGTGKDNDAADDDENARQRTAPLSTFLFFFCRVFLFTEILVGDAAGSNDDTRCPAALWALVSLFRYHDAHQSTKLKGSITNAFFDLVGYMTRYGSREKKTYLLSHVLCALPSDGTQSTCDRSEDDNDSKVAHLLAHLTQTSGSFLWACPLLVLAAEEELAELSIAEEMAQAVLHAGFALQRGGLAAAEEEDTADNKNNGCSSSLSFRTRLYCGNASLCLGLLCAALSAGVMEEFVKTISCTSIAPLQPYVTFLLQALRVPRGVCASESAERRVLSQATGGLHKMQTVASARVALLSEAERKTVEEKAKIYEGQLQKQLEEAQRLQAERERFEAKANELRKEKEDEHARISAELMSRREFGARQKQMEREQREKLKQIALQKIQREKETSRQVQVAESAQRLRRYKEKMTSTFRVTQFLESVHVPTSRIMEIRAALQPVLATITPDELMEYVVTGVAVVPKDMLSDGDDDNDDEDNTPQAAGEGPEARQHAVERRKKDGKPPAAAALSFWDQVLNSKPEAPPEAAMERETRLSFHARVGPFLDLFCYEGGDELGNLPAVLPFLRLSAVKRVTPLSVLRQFHFSTALELFQTLQRHHLVVLSADGIAQLTVLGYRYHFPYHDPESMLEVRVLRGRERIRDALLKSAENRNAEGSGGASEFDSSASDSAAQGEEGEEEAEEEGDDVSDWDDNRILPELVFDI